MDYLEKQPIVVYKKVLKRVSHEQIVDETIEGVLYVLFIDSETNKVKLAIPSYKGLEYYSQETALEKSTYHCGFIEDTESKSNDTFEILYDKEREVRQMVCLLDPNMNCLNYLYESSDPTDFVYPTSTCKTKKMVFI